MEKTTHISIGRTEFVLEERAYMMLDAYLTSLRTYFADDPNCDEIISDIESRIAEKLIEEKHGIITKETIEVIITHIGSPAELHGEETGGDTATSAKPYASRKLYRDPETAIVAGISSGIAAYFGIDPIIIRLLFILSIFFGGFGIVLYFLLWLLLPKAQTTSQKLQMHGEPVTVETVRRRVESKITDGPRRNMILSILYFPFEIIGALLRTLALFLPGAAKVVGVLLAVGSFFGILSVTTLAALGAVHFNAPYFEFPLREAVSHPLVYGAIAIGWVVFTIPLVFLIILGLRLMGRSVLSSAHGFGLVGIWSVALIALAVIGTQVGGQYVAYIQTNPAYEEVSTVVAVDPFESILAAGIRVRIAHGDTHEVTFEGRARDVERMSASVEEGRLTISERPEESCIFCDSGSVGILVRTPNLERIEMRGGQTVLEELVLDTLEINAERGYITGVLQAQYVEVTGTRTQIDLSGSTEEAVFVLQDTHLWAPSFEIADAEITAKNWTQATLNVSGTLHIDADEDSEVEYSGTPAVTRGE